MLLSKGIHFFGACVVGGLGYFAKDVAQESLKLAEPAYRTWEVGAKWAFLAVAFGTFISRLSAFP